MVDTRDQVRKITKMLTPRQLAVRWGWNVGSLANQRMLGRGPMYRRIGRSVVYLMFEIEAYEARHPEVFKSSTPRRRSRRKETQVRGPSNPA